MLGKQNVDAQWNVVRYVRPRSTNGGNSKTESTSDGMATSNFSAKCRPQRVAVATILIHFESQARRLSKEAMRHATKSTASHRKISVKNQRSSNWITRSLLKPPTTVVATTNTSTRFGQKPVRNMLHVPELPGADGPPNRVCADERTKFVGLDGCLEIWRP